MRGYDIANVLKKDILSRRVFKGVFPRDVLQHLPVNSRHPSAYIINTASHNEPGEHWVAVWLHGGRGEYFDSYGLPPIKEHIEKFMKKHCRYYQWNRRVLQGILSNTCGHYCLYYILQKARGHSMDRICARFNTFSHYANDKRVEMLTKPFFLRARF